MRTLVTFVTLALAATSWIAADQRPASSPAPAAMLTVDSIMRGPKLVGAPPSAIQWSRPIRPGP
jgi:hypothetical protein